MKRRISHYMVSSVLNKMGQVGPHHDNLPFTFRATAGFPSSVTPVFLPNLGSGFPKDYYICTLGWYKGNAPLKYQEKYTAPTGQIGPTFFLFFNPSGHQPVLWDLNLPTWCSRGLQLLPVELRRLLLRYSSSSNPALSWFPNFRTFLLGSRIRRCISWWDLWFFFAAVLMWEWRLLAICCFWVLNRSGCRMHFLAPHKIVSNKPRMNRRDSFLNPSYLFLCVCPRSRLLPWYLQI